MRLLCFTVFIVLFHMGASGQEMDSLLNVWNDTSKPDSLRFKAINELSWMTTRINPQKAEELAREQMAYAQEKGEEKYVAKALGTIAVTFWARGDFDTALEYGLQRLNIEQELNDSSGLAKAYGNLGLYYSDKGDNLRAFDYYQQAVQIEEALGDSLSMAGSYNSMGVIYKALGDYDKALVFYQKALRLLENNGGADYKIASMHHNLGSLYMTLNEHDKGKQYYDETLKRYEEINYGLGVGAIYQDIGAYYEEMNQYDSAEVYYLRSAELLMQYEKRQFVNIAYFHLGHINLLKGNNNEALKWCSKGVAMAEEIGDPTGERSNCQCLYTVYKELGQKGKALDYYERYNVLNDTLTSKKTTAKVLRKEFQYSYDKQVLADSLAFAQQQELANVQHEAALKQEQTRRYALYGGLSLALLLLGIAIRSYRIKKKANIVIAAQRDRVEEQKNTIEEQKEIVEEKNKEILDSINYAKRIQAAILPPGQLVKTHLKDSFILYQPKDIVAGDFYWLEQKGEKVLFAAADCTGHGVPGAMVSVICNNALNRSVREHGLVVPGKVLDKTREIVVQEFEKSEEEVKDGMDIALCAFNTTTRELEYAGANNPLWVIKPGENGEKELLEIKPTKQPIGKVDAPVSFTTHRLTLNPGDVFYVFSDGFADQFGGERGKKLKSSGFKTLLLSIQDKSITEQHQALHEFFESWKGSHEQLDDVCVIGIRA